MCLLFKVIPFAVISCKIIQNFKFIGMIFLINVLSIENIGVPRANCI